MNTSSNATPEQEKCSEKDWPRSTLNPKYRQMVGEFVYKDIPWVSWTTRERILRAEEEFTFYSDDLLLATYPKSGTTLLQEMVWLLTHSADLETARRLKVFARIPFLEENYKTVFPGETEPSYPIDYLPNMSRPRTIKTHLPFRHLEDRFKECGYRMILALRNPKDTMVSCFHFYRGTEDYGPFRGSWDEFFDMWMDGWIVGGAWLDVVREWLSAMRTHKDRILLVKFEDMTQNPGGTIARLAEFLGVQNWREMEEVIIRNTRFSVMRDNPMTNYKDVESFDVNFRFMRRGEVGDWRRWFTVEQNIRFDRIYQPALSEMGLDFDYGGPL